jgi:hypothetical protein
MTTDEIISRCYEHGQPDYILAADRLKELKALLTATPAIGDRQAVARYVCGHFLCALDDCSCEPGTAAFKHADAILSLPVLPGAGEREAARAFMEEK